MTELTSTGVASYFNENYYLAQYSDVRTAVEGGSFSSGLQHYQLYGGRELRNPTSQFNAAYYVSANPDVGPAITQGFFQTPLDHFNLFGVGENRAPSSGVANLDTARYLAENADVQTAVTNGTFKSALDHYLRFGEAESRPAYNASGGTIIAPGDSFTLTAAAASVNEGATINFTLQSTNVAAGAQYIYTISGVSAADVQGGSLTGTVTIGADGRALIPVTMVADNTTEGWRS